LVVLCLGSGIGGIAVLPLADAVGVGATTHVDKGEAFPSVLPFLGVPYYLFFLAAPTYKQAYMCIKARAAVEAASARLHP
jgi:hypothetical protein